MSQQPPRNSYKAFLWDYDSLLSYSDEECCYSLSEREIQILLAQVDPIAWKTRYKPTETEIDLSLIDKWKSNLARKLMSGCCPDDDTLGRFGEGGIWEESDDGGITYHPAPENDPRNNYVGAPPLPGAPSSGKRCAGADNVRQRFLEQRDYIIGELTDWQFIPAILGGLLAFLAAIAGVSGAAIGVSVLLMGLATALLTMTPESVEEQIDDTALDAFKCLVYCQMNNDGQLTDAAWSALLADITEEFSGFPETFFYNTVNAWGVIGMNNAASIGVATASDCSGCECVPFCESGDSFYAGTVNTITDNEDGTFTYNVSSVDNGSGVQFIGWGDRENAGSPCCEFLSYIDEVDLGALGGAVQGCGSGDEVAVPPLGGNCYHFFLVYHDAELGTPFTADITFQVCD